MKCAQRPDKAKRISERAAAALLERRRAWGARRELRALQVHAAYIKARFAVRDACAVARSEPDNFRYRARDSMPDALFGGWLMMLYGDHSDLGERP